MADVLLKYFFTPPHKFNSSSYYNTVYTIIPTFTFDTLIRQVKAELVMKDFYTVVLLFFI